MTLYHVVNENGEQFGGPFNSRAHAESDRATCDEIYDGQFYVEEYDLGQRTRVDPDHSVTCALCGKHADERETVSWSSLDDPVVEPEASMAMKHTIAECIELVGDGEAHQECFELAMEQGVEWWVNGDE